MTPCSPARPVVAEVGTTIELIFRDKTQAKLDQPHCLTGNELAWTRQIQA